ncbi:hypothetical protein GCM10027580_18750 [Corynebacterium faecale]
MAQHRGIITVEHRAGLLRDYTDDLEFTDLTDRGTTLQMIREFQMGHVRVSS